jgi:hypothetical protein
MSTQRWMVVCLLAAMAGGLGGCATYVNVPAQSGDVAQNDPNYETVTQVEATAVLAALQEQPVPGVLTLDLPAGSRPQTYQTVLKGLPENVTAEKAEGRKIVSVRQVRVRGWYAQADVVHPGVRPDDPPHLVTVSLRWEWFKGWQPQGVKQWRIPVDDALKQSQLESEQQINPNAPQPNKEATNPNPN